MLSAFKKYLNIKGIDIQKEDDITISFTYNGLFYIFVHDKSDPEAIKREFGISKASFKRAVGHLLKQEKIEMTEDGISLKSRKVLF